MKQHFALRLRRYARANKGGVLVEVAFVTLLLMVLVIGMGSMNVEISAVENAGRSLKEVTEIGTQMIEEEGELTPESQIVLLEMIMARTGTPEEDINLRITHVERNAFTGEYFVVSETNLGGLTIPGRISVASLPEPNPGVSILGERLTLDLGQGFRFFEITTAYDPIPRGVRPTRTYQQVSVVLIP